MTDLQQINCAIYRGGTSKALFFMEQDLPKDVGQRSRMFLSLMGSPDVRQIDGLGGSDITTSKIAIIGPPTRADADVDYTFAQVFIERPEVSFQGNCGNISSAVGPFAIDHGMVPAAGDSVTVRIHNTNTNKILVAQVPLSGGQAAVAGDFSIPGVPGTGAMISMDFADTSGSATGLLLPTGNPLDELIVDGLGSIQVSIVDVANPVVFVRAEDIGASGVEHRLQINTNPELMEKLEAIRGAAAEAAGIVQNRGSALTESPLVPQIAFISPAVDYEDYGSGRVIQATDVSFLARVIFNQMAVDTYTGTGSICTAAAAMIPGSLVNRAASDEARQTGQIRIGHARGALEVEAQVRHDAKGPVLEKAVIRRTARRLMEGQAYYRSSTVA